MICVGCREACPGVVCPECARDLVAPSEVWLGGVLVRSAFRHEGVARVLVHRLKYGATPLPGLARAVAGVLPATATALVPVPRTTLRRWRYGVDPALEIARWVGALTGLAVVRALGAPWWVHRRAGGAGAVHGRPRFRRTGVPVPAGAVLVDDVVTTGTTLVAASAVTGLSIAVTVTSAVRP